MVKNILDKNNYLIKLDNLKRFCVYDVSIPMQTFKIAYNNGVGTGVALGLDLKEETISLGKREMSQNIERTFVSEISNQNIDMIISLGDIMLDSRKISSDIFHYIQKNNYEFIITTGRIASGIQDDSRFMPNLASNDDIIKLDPTSLYKIGNFDSVDIYVDPFMRFDDELIICGRKNKIKFNFSIENIEEGNYNPTSFQEKLLLTYKFGMQIESDSFTSLYLIENLNSNSYRKNLPKIRERKIDCILD